MGYISFNSKWFYFWQYFGICIFVSLLNLNDQKFRSVTFTCIFLYCAKEAEYPSFSIHWFGKWDSFYSRIFGLEIDLFTLQPSKSHQVLHKKGRAMHLSHRKTANLNKFSLSLRCLKSYVLSAYENNMPCACFFSFFFLKNLDTIL